MNSNDRAFTKFVKKTAGAGSPLEADGDGPEEQDDNRYRAFRLGQSGRPQLRLRLYAENGVVSLMTYAYLTEVVSGSHQYLTLVFTNCLIDLFGRNLTALLDPLQDGKIRALYCYHKEHYPEPAENEPVIYSIKRDALYAARAAQEASKAR
jgi:hypothetical protein